MAQLGDIPSWWQLCSLWSCGWVSPGFSESCACSGEVTPPLGSSGRSWSLHGAWECAPGQAAAGLTRATSGTRPAVGKLRSLEVIPSHSTHFSIMLVTEALMQVPPCTVYPNLAGKPQGRQLSGLGLDKAFLPRAKQCHSTRSHGQTSDCSKAYTKQLLMTDKSPNTVNITCLSNFFYKF